MEITIGSLVKSMAGHDKDEVFFILKEEVEYVYLVDGKYRTLARPKRKNRKHVEAVSCEADCPGKKIRENQRVTNEEIARFIKCFKKKQ